MNDGHGQKLNLQLPNSARNTRSPKLFFLFSIKRFVSVTFVGITIKKKREREKSVKTGLIIKGANLAFNSFFDKLIQP
jgi:hypothetical protein